MYHEPVKPVEDIIIFELDVAFPMAQNNDNSGDQQITYQLVYAGCVCVVHVNPFGDVIITEPLPAFETAQNNPNSGDQHIPLQVELGIALAVCVQLTPSDEVDIYVDELLALANNPNCGDQATH